MGILGLVESFFGGDEDDNVDNEDKAGDIVTEDEDPIPDILPDPPEGLFDDESDEFDGGAV